MTSMKQKRDQEDLFSWFFHRTREREFQTKMMSMAATISFTNEKKYETRESSDLMEKTEIWEKQQEQPWSKSFQIFEIVERVGVLSAFMCHGVCGHGFGCACGCACGCARGCEGGCGRVKEEKENIQDCE